MTSATLRAGWYRATAHPVARVLSSPRLTIAGLACLFILVVAGTLYQANHGIYETTHRFFRSWIAWLGPVPFPGAQPVLWLLALNLVASALFRIRWIATNSGLLILHLGLALLLVGGIGASVVSRSGLLGLAEGQRAEVSHDPYRWEMHLGTPRGLVTLPFEELTAGLTLESPIAGLSMVVTRALTATRPVLDEQGNVVGTQPVMPAREAEDNIPALTLRLTTPGSGTRDLELWGGDTRPLRIVTGDVALDVWLGRKAYPLPAAIRLDRFEAEFHPGTDVPSRFESSVTVGEGPGERTARITMNRPLTLGGQTLYQTSWGRDAEGRLLSVFEVVDNPARLWPYLSSLIIVAGLVAHLVLRRGAAA